MWGGGSLPLTHPRSLPPIPPSHPRSIPRIPPCWPLHSSILASSWLTPLYFLASSHCLLHVREGGAPALDQYLRSKWCRRSGNTHILAPSLSCTPAASSISPSWLHPGSCIVSIFCQTGAPMLLRMLKQEHMQCCNCTLPSQRPQRAVSIPSMRH